MAAGGSAPELATSMIGNPKSWKSCLLYEKHTLETDCPGN